MNGLQIFAMHEQRGPFALKYYNMLQCLYNNCRCDGECPYKPKLLPSQKKEGNSIKTPVLGKLPRN